MDARIGFADRCGMSFRRGWPASAIFVAGSTKSPYATEFRQHLFEVTTFVG